MADIDIPYLANTFSLPESDIDSLLSAPSVPLVQSLLQHLSAFAKSYEEVKADKLKADVEFEAAVRSGDARARQLKDSNEKRQKEIEDLRRQLNTSGKPPDASALYSTI